MVGYRIDLVFARENIENFLRTMYEEFDKSNLDLALKLASFRNAFLSLETGYKIGIVSCNKELQFYKGNEIPIVEDIQDIFNLYDSKKINMKETWERLAILK